MYIKMISGGRCVGKADLARRAKQLMIDIGGVLTADYSDIQSGHRIERYTLEGKDYVWITPQVKHSYAGIDGQVDAPDLSTSNIDAHFQSITNRPTDIKEDL